MITPRRVIEASIVAAAIMLLVGCGSSDETTTTTQQGEVREQATPQKGTFESETRTVATEPKHATPETSAVVIPSFVRFTVQIGAFKDPQNASRVQSLARERFRLPIVNDYAADRKLYQIRVGFFETRESATAFRQDMIRVYPADYRNSWVIQLDN